MATKKNQQKKIQKVSKQSEEYLARYKVLQHILVVKR